MTNKILLVKAAAQLRNASHMMNPTIGPKYRETADELLNVFKGITKMEKNFREALENMEAALERAKEEILRQRLKNMEN